jgi:hypothetical protein
MKLELDVWLERAEPCITLRDAGSGQVLLQWDGEAVRRELASGDLCMEDLCDTGLSCAERLGLVAQAQPGRPRHVRLGASAPCGDQADRRIRFLPSRLAR